MKVVLINKKPLAPPEPTDMERYGRTDMAHVHASDPYKNRDKSVGIKSIAKLARR